MINWTTHQTANIITKTMESIWHKRRELLKPGQLAYFDFRIKPMESEEDSVFVYFVLSGQWWWYTISQTPPFDICRGSLIFQDSGEPEDWKEQATSYRHYLFNDVFYPVLLKRLDSLDTYTFYVPSIFPLHAITMGELK